VGGVSVDEDYNTILYLYNILFTYIMCVCMCVCTILFYCVEEGGGGGGGGVHSSGAVCIMAVVRIVFICVCVCIALLVFCGVSSGLLYNIYYYYMRRMPLVGDDSSNRVPPRSFADVGRCGGGGRREFRDGRVRRRRENLQWGGEGLLQAE